MTNKTNTIIRNTGAKSGTSEFILPNKKVTLLPIVRRKSFMGRKDHDGLFMYTNANKSWSIFRDQYGNYIDPLNETERLYLEKMIGEDLNVNHKDNYWHSFSFKITKDTYEMSRLKRVFDLSNPRDFLAYKLLLTVPDVANSLKEKDDTPEYEWMLVEADETIQDKLSAGRIKRFCYNWLTENEKKKTTLRNILYTMNISISKDASIDEIENAIIDIIESNRINSLYELLNDENLDTKILFAKALKSRCIILRRSKFYDEKGELLAVNKQKMLEWFADPEHSVELVAMKEKIDKIKF